MLKMNLTGKKIAVTGGVGFLGRRIVEKLSEKGAYIAIPRKAEYDFTDLSKAKQFYDDHNPDLLIHSAALYGGLGINERMPAEIFDYNMRMLLNLANASISGGKPRLEKVIWIGSACSYPSVLGTNMREELSWAGPVDKSVRNYGTVKKLMETVGHVYRDQFNLNSITLHLATLYGEGDTFNPERSHVPAALMRKFVEARLSGDPSVELWGVPDSVREFMYVGDCAEGIVRATESFEGLEDVNDQSKYTLNIGTGEGITIETLANTIKDIVGYTGNLTYNGKSAGQKEKALEVSRMRRVLDWIPPTTLEQGLRKTIDWYMAHKEEADKRF